MTLEFGRDDVTAVVGEREPFADPAGRAGDKRRRSGEIPVREWVAAFEATLLRGYHRLTLAVGRPGADTDRIELSSEESDRRTDLLADDVTRALLRRSDVRRVAGRGVLDPEGVPGEPTVTVQFADGAVHYRTASPESTLVAVDRAVRSLP